MTNTKLMKRTKGTVISGVQKRAMFASFLRDHKGEMHEDVRLGPLALVPVSGGALFLYAQQQYNEFEGPEDYFIRGEVKIILRDDAGFQRMAALCHAFPEKDLKTLKGKVDMCSAKITFEDNETQSPTTDQIVADAHKIVAALTYARDRSAAVEALSLLMPALTSPEAPPEVLHLYQETIALIRTEKEDEFENIAGKMKLVGDHIASGFEDPDLLERTKKALGMK